MLNLLYNLIIILFKKFVEYLKKIDENLLNFIQKNRYYFMLF